MTICIVTKDYYQEQLNLLTPYIDASQIYGMDATKAASLRTFSGGCCFGQTNMSISSHRTICDS